MSRDDLDSMDAVPEDDELHRRLRQYRPLAPPAQLRRRLFEPEPAPRRAWPWAVAAAAMLAAAVALQSSSAALVSELAGSEADPAVVEAAALAALLGGDRESEIVAAGIVRMDSMRMALMAPSVAGEGQ